MNYLLLILEFGHSKASATALGLFAGSGIILFAASVLLYPTDGYKIIGPNKDHWRNGGSELNAPLTWWKRTLYQRILLRCAWVGFWFTSAGACINGLMVMSAFHRRLISVEVTQPMIMFYLALLSLACVSGLCAIIHYVIRHFCYSPNVK